MIEHFEGAERQIDRLFLSASAIVSKTTSTTSSAWLRLSSSGSQTDLSLPLRFGDIAFTTSRCVTRFSNGHSTSIRFQMSGLQPHKSQTSMSVQIATITAGPARNA
jgi:hypothetical protein